MIRFTKALALAATLLIVPSIVSAATISIVNVTGEGADGTLEAGGTVTFDLSMSTDAGPLNGLGVSVTGYDVAGANFDRELGLAFESATVVTEAFGVIVPGAPAAFRNGPIANSTLGEEVFSINHLSPQAYTTNLFQGVGLTPALGDGSDDLGISGNLVTGGDVHFRVTFSNVADFIDSANLTLSFDVSTISNLGTTTTNSTPFALTVIPEPGTALLMGLGLAGLAGFRRN